MLEQILKDMYIDPELLELLDEQQKQTLFCQMREEQVRRWKVWNEKLDQAPKPKIENRKKKKNVSFLQGADGEDWVWVMGEHKDDKTIEEILKEEEREKARKMAEEETVELRKQVEAQMNEYNIDCTTNEKNDEFNQKIEDFNPKIDDFNPKIDDFNPKIDDFNQKIDDYNPKNDIDEGIYCSVEELREKIHNKHKTKFNLNDYNQTKNNRFKNFVDTNRCVIKEMTKKPEKVVASRIALWEQKLTEERTCEILKNIQIKKEEQKKEAEENALKQEELWREQERKAKQAEQQIREIARRAREEHRLTSNLEIVDTSYSAVNSGAPPGRQAVIEWYRTYEKGRSAGLNSSNNVQPWFHGLITRQEAEKLLLDQPYGTFLVRLSERIWGYAISYRAKEKCKHYLVNSAQKYKFVNNTMEHNTLADLITYHHGQPLNGGEKLIHPCPRISEAALEELINS